VTKLTPAWASSNSCVEPIFHSRQKGPKAALFDLRAQHLVKNRTV
jgi:hypothetical protein